VSWGAGIGEGSSDAASTLLALNRLWGLGWARERLAALGMKLGADVPFFIGGHNAFVEGIGERLSTLPVPPAWLAVLKPPAAIETRAIFGSPLLVRDTEAVILAGFLADTAGSVRRVLEGFGRNDLQPPAEAHCADVVTAREILQRRFGNARMTGSGSAVFARAGTGAEPMATMPADLPPGWVGRMCRSLEQHPLVGWALD
jgi:4-diphosphocytidyl-2-C-methyl-D-erythritol kinase